MKSVKFLLFITLVIPLNLYAYEDSNIGSPEFVEFSRGTQPWSELVWKSNSNEVNSNLPFAKVGWPQEIHNEYYPLGSSHRHYYARQANFMANYTHAAASSDTRSPLFINNALIPMMETLPPQEGGFGTTEGTQESILAAQQAGDMSKKYIASGILDPKIGYFQSSDNQAAFDATHKNILLGESEQALFQKDKSEGISFFNNKTQSYKSNTSKQLSASNYQKQAMLRSKETARKFSNFFSLKSDMTKESLRDMPNNQSILNKCNSLTPKNFDSNATFNASVPQWEIAFYPTMEPASFGIDHCDQYVQDNNQYLVNNQHLYPKMEKIINDSQEMAIGLDEIAKHLNQKMTVVEIGNYLSTHPTWIKLAQRKKAWDECGDCLKEHKKDVIKLTEYQGFEKDSSDTKMNDLDSLKSIILSGKINHTFLSNTSNKFKSKKGNKRKTQKTIRGMKRNKFKGKFTVNAPDLTGEQEMNQESSIKFSSYWGKLSVRPGELRRDGRGILRGYTGKVIPGYEGARHENIFKIISRRYQYHNELFPLK